MLQALDPAGTLPDLKPVLDRLARGVRLSEAEAEAAFELVMAGAATPAQIAALLMGLRVRGETVAELVGAVRAMRARMRRVEAPADTIDVCGTGGDRHGTLNISTAVAFVLAALGLPVAKHGNRAISSRAGATDVLTALGVPPPGDPEALGRQIALQGIAFLSAPAHHPALRHAAGVRAELGTRTLFNLLGPLCNPASVTLQLIGVFDAAWLEPVARTLQQLGSRRVWVVHGENRLLPGGPGLDGPGLDNQGLDELTLAGPSRVVALEAGRLHHFTLTPELVGLAPAPVSAIAGGDAAHNAAVLEALLRGGREGCPPAYRDTVLFNAGAALRVARGGNMFPPGPDAPDLRAAIALAAEALDGGAAWRVLEGLRDTGVRHQPRDREDQD